MCLLCFRESKKNYRFVYQNLTKGLHVFLETINEILGGDCIFEKK